MVVGRPHDSEYPAHYRRYVALVPEEDICAAMTQQMDETIERLTAISATWADSRYAPRKWTIREVVGHILDTERIYGFRLLTFARGDAVALSRADQELCVTNGDFGRFTLQGVGRGVRPSASSTCGVGPAPTPRSVDEDRHGVRCRGVGARSGVCDGRPRTAPPWHHSE
jgi:hypothetical protein